MKLPESVKGSVNAPEHETSGNTRVYEKGYGSKLWYEGASVPITDDEVVELCRELLDRSGEPYKVVPEDALVLNPKEKKEVRDILCHS